MKKAKVVVILGAALLFMSFATCVGGWRYAIRQLPPNEREAMTDFDWVGTEWIAAGSVICLVGVVLIAGGGVSLLRRKIP